MAQLTWDQSGSRFYETGVDKAVLYIPNSLGAYTTGYSWNGLTSVTESPTGAEPNPIYADNIKYLNLYSVEEFGATLEAYTYPNEFAQFDGMAQPTSGITVGQQARGRFGLSYRTRLGNDVYSDELGYKLHLIYGCQASPTEKGYNTVNDSPEAITFSWEIATTKVAVTGYKPVSIMTIDSTKVNSTALLNLENFLYGTSGTNPSLPLPDAVIALFSGTVSVATPTAPTYNTTTKVITIPTVTGVTYRINGVALVAGAQPAITATTIVQATPNNGFVFPANTDDDFQFTF